MKKAAEYHRRDYDCRKLARPARSASQRTQLLLMAAAWLVLADQRLRMVGYRGARDEPGAALVTPPAPAVADAPPPAELRAGE